MPQTANSNEILKDDYKVTKNKFQIIISVVILVIIVFITFSPCLKNGFTNWDDDVLLINNPLVRSLSLTNVFQIFKSFNLIHYNPLITISFAKEYFLFELNPFIYHFNNLLLHLINTIFVFIIFLIISNKIFAAFLTSLLFGIHPMHVESVAWITGRIELLCFFFLSISYIFYLYYLKQNAGCFEKTNNTVNKKLLFLSVLFFICAVLSKSVAMGAPIIYLLTDYLLNRKIDKKIILEKIPFFLLLIPFVFIAVMGLHKTKGIPHPEGYDILDNMLIVGYSIVFYVGKLIVPLNLSCLYPYPQKSGEYLPLIFWFTPIALILIFIMILKSLKYTKKFAFGILFFLIFILPSLRFIPLGLSFAADRYTYISYLGLFYIFAENITYLCFKKYRKNSFLEILIFFFLVIILTLFSIVSFNRCFVWRDSITLWTDVIKKYPDLPIAYNNRATAYSDIGQYDMALKDFDAAQKKSPSYAKTYYNRGVVYEKLGQINIALEEYHSSLKYEPKLQNANYNIANILLNTKKIEESIFYYTKEIQNYPSNINALTNRGIAYVELSKFNEALSDFNMVLSLNKTFITAYMHRGNLFFKTGNFDKAISDFSEAVKINPKFYDAYFNRAYAYFMMKNFKMAWLDIKKLKEVNYSIPEEFLTNLTNAQPEK